MDLEPITLFSFSRERKGHTVKPVQGRETWFTFRLKCWLQRLNGFWALGMVFSRSVWSGKSLSRAGKENKDQISLGQGPRASTQGILVHSNCLKKNTTFDTYGICPPTWRHFYCKFWFVNRNLELLAFNNEIVIYIYSTWQLRAEQMKLGEPRS